MTKTSRLTMPAIRILFTLRNVGEPMRGCHISDVCLQNYARDSAYHYLEVLYAEGCIRPVRKTGPEWGITAKGEKVLAELENLGTWIREGEEP